MEMLCSVSANTCLQEDIYQYMHAHTTHTWCVHAWLQTE